MAMAVIEVSEFKFDLPGLHSLCLLPARSHYRAIALLFWQDLSNLQWQHLEMEEPSDQRLLRLPSSNLRSYKVTSKVIWRSTWP